MRPEQYADPSTGLRRAPTQRPAVAATAASCAAPCDRAASHGPARPARSARTVLRHTLTFGGLAVAATGVAVAAGVVHTHGTA